MTSATTRDKLDFLIGSFDAYLQANYEPGTAWQSALNDYAYVYHHDDGRPPIARAAERTLKLLGEQGKTDE